MARLRRINSTGIAIYYAIRIRSKLEIVTLTGNRPEWRNWYTRTTQNRVGNPCVGSSPTSGTKQKIALVVIFLFSYLGGKRTRKGSGKHLFSRGGNTKTEGF